VDVPCASCGQRTKYHAICSECYVSMTKSKKKVKKPGNAPTKDSLRELKKLTAQLAKRDAKCQKLDDYAINAARRLRKLSNENTPAKQKKRGDFNTCDVAPAVAKFLSLFVHNWDSGEFLCIEWAIDRLLGDYVKRSIGKIDRIYQELVNGNYTQRKPIRYHCDRAVYWVPVKNPDDSPHFSRLAFVLDTQSQRYIVIIENLGSIGRKLHVRKLFSQCDSSSKWPNKVPSLKKFIKDGVDPEYGDCRDAGYVLSCEWGMAYIGTKVDRGFDHFGDVTNFLWMIRSTLEVILNPELRE